jgi:hypothetical protein
MTELVSYQMQNTGFRRTFGELKDTTKAIKTLDKKKSSITIALVEHNRVSPKLFEVFLGLMSFGLRNLQQGA